MHEQANFHLCSLTEGRAFTTARAAIETSFTLDEEQYGDEQPEAFHRRVAQAQDIINERGVGSSIAWHLRGDLRRLLGPGQIMIQAGMFLRATRPNGGGDAIGWHRESMYGGPPGTWNVWVPLVRITPDNALCYVPGSAAISDDELVITADRQGAIERGSDGQTIGLLYAPKRIVRGVDLSKAEPMLVPLGSAALFPGSLIHGAGVNRGNKIRFSLDMRVIAQRDLWPDGARR